MDTASLIHFRLPQLFSETIFFSSVSAAHLQGGFIFHNTTLEIYMGAF